MCSRWRWKPFEEGPDELEESALSDRLEQALIKAQADLDAAATNAGSTLAHTLEQIGTLWDSDETVLTDEGEQSWSSLVRGADVVKLP